MYCIRRVILLELFSLPQLEVRVDFVCSLALSHEIIHWLLCCVTRAIRYPQFDCHRVHLVNQGKQMTCYYCCLRSSWPRWLTFTAHATTRYTSEAKTQLASCHILYPLPSSSLCVCIAVVSALSQDKRQRDKLQCTCRRVLK